MPSLPGMAFGFSPSNLGARVSRFLIPRSCPSVAALLLAGPGVLFQTGGAPAVTVSPAALAHEDDSPALRQRVLGRVRRPDGSPAVGALVVTSAGGQALTEADGGFALEVDVPLDATCVEVTAALEERSGASLFARTRFAPASRASRVPIGELLLGPAANAPPRWLPTVGERPGFQGGAPTAVAVFDDGSGPALYVGGSFTSAGVVSTTGIARWDGRRWAAVGGGTDFLVQSLAVLDTGGGPALYAGGNFLTAGGVPASRIARWNGASWAALGSGMDSPVLAMTVFDDGTGPALYAGGTFTNAGGVAAHHVARWNGSSWTPLGSGTSGTVRTLTIFDDGNGAALYAGGDFSTAGGLSVNGVARWDGSSWAPLGTGMVGPFPFPDLYRVHALLALDDGNGPALFAGGEFASAGGVTVKHVARWDGASWAGLGSGMSAPVQTLLAFDDGAGPRLLAGGSFTTAAGVPAAGIARWDGTDWEAVPDEAGTYACTGVVALAAFDDGRGASLHAVGGFLARSDGLDTRPLARWNGAGWAPLGSGFGGGVEALALLDDGTGPALSLGGEFSTAGGIGANGTVRWDGEGWTALGAGSVELSGGPSVHALALHDDGNGPALYAGSASRVGKWDGSSWTVLRSFGNDVLALASFDDGSGPALYVAGAFTQFTSGSLNHVARWNGASWTQVGSGTNGIVRALVVFDDGTGPALYAGGSFGEAGGVAASRTARWDGTSWSPLGAGLLGDVYALAVFDDGSGPALYAGGTFSAAGGLSANRIARWNGTSWAPLGSGVNRIVQALSVFDDGSGPALYAGGDFTTAGGLAANRIARWDGTSWSALGNGVGDRVLALLPFGRTLVVGGRFLTSPAGDSHLARWGCPPRAVKRNRL